MRTKPGFTLIEVLLVTLLASGIIISLITLYTQINKMRVLVEAKENVIQQSYHALEKIQTLMKNYTIDYEEYFNRKTIGCNARGEGRNVGENGYCEIFSTYGNQNSIHPQKSTQHILYVCTSQDRPSNNSNLNEQFSYTNETQPRNGCIPQNSYNTMPYQSFGEYKLQFLDAKRDVDNNSFIKGDDDDKDMGSGPEAISDPTKVQELYLISPDQTKRTYFRRVLVLTGDFDHDGITGNSDIDKVYSLELLSLRGFDAGEDHSFSVSKKGVYDGQIDTRSCDADQGFNCKGESVGGIYDKFHIPLDGNDGRVNLLPDDITIRNRNITISPSKKHEYSWAENSSQVSPFITLNIDIGLNPQKRSGKIPPDTLKALHMELQTTFAVKSWY